MQIPITGSTAQFLCKVYFNQSVDNFINNLPHGAKVLDIGAGISPLGLVVTTARPDITWVNADYSYDGKLVNELKASAPDNLNFIKDDITKTSFDPAHDTFDLILSFWVLPWIGLSGVCAITKVLTTMQKLLNTGGKVVLGPLVGERADNLHELKTLWAIGSIDKNTAANEINLIANKLLIPEDRLWRYKAVAKSGVAVMKHASRTGQKPSLFGLYYAKKAKYLRLYTPIGFALAGYNLWCMATEYLSAIARNNVDKHKHLSDIEVTHEEV